MIPYGRQNILRSDIKSVSRALKSESIAQGPLVPDFESQIAKLCGSDFGVAVNSATSALHIACLSLGLGKGDYLWTSPNSFVASATCGVLCGAKIDFVDINQKSYNLDVIELEKKLEIAKINNTLPKILIPVHYAGQSCEMKRIFELSRQYNFKIIEDASHAIGAKYKNSLVGNCQYSDITVFSFHPVKIITTAEGGIALTNQAALAKKMNRLRSHGITTDKELFEFRQEDEIWNYQQTELGFNYRMTELQASLGISQLKRINTFIKKRKKIVERYNSYLKELPLVLPWQHPDSESSFHLYPIMLPNQNKGLNQKKLFLHLKSVGINVNIHYIPIHRQPYFEKLGFQEGSFPKSEKFFKSAISLPIFPDLKKSQQMYVINEIKRAFAL